MGRKIFWAVLIASSLALCAIILAERAFSNGPSIPGKNSCGYWKQAVASWMQDAEPIGYGAYPIFVPEGKEKMGQMSIWVKPSGDWAILESSKHIDAGSKKEGTWVCILSRGVGFRQHGEYIKHVNKILLMRTVLLQRLSKAVNVLDE